MRKLTKSIVGACAAATVLSSVAIVAHAAQDMSRWSGTIDFWTDIVGTSVIEKDEDDKVSHIIWESKNDSGNFKLKFTIQLIEDGSNQNDQLYIDSTYGLGTEVAFASKCIEGKDYRLVAARESIFDPAIYCVGSWEP